MKKILIVDIILIILIYLIPDKSLEKPQIETAEIIEVKEENILQTEETAEETAEEKLEEKTLQNYKITSYYEQDGYRTTNITGSGKTTSDFTLIPVENKMVYGYQGRIVVAAATNELLKSGYNMKGSQKAQEKHYFDYGDTGRVKINNKWYGFIVLDSCGAAMWEGYYRLDIFVPDSKNAIDIKNVEIIYD